MRLLDGLSGILSLMVVTMVSLGGPGLAPASGAGDSGQRADDGGGNERQQRPEAQPVGLDEAEENQRHAGDGGADEQQTAVDSPAFQWGTKPPRTCYIIVGVVRRIGLADPSGRVVGVRVSAALAHRRAFPGLLLVLLALCFFSLYARPALPVAAGGKLRGPAPESGYFADFEWLERYCRRTGHALVETSGQVSTMPMSTKEAGDPLLRGGT